MTLKFCTSLAKRSKLKVRKFWLLIFGEKMLRPAYREGCVTWIIFFSDLLKVRYNCAKSHHCGICVTDFREVGLFAPIREQPQKGPSLIGLTAIVLPWKKTWQIFPLLCRYTSSKDRVKQKQIPYYDIINLYDKFL